MCRYRETDKLIICADIERLIRRIEVCRYRETDILIELEI